MRWTLFWCFVLTLHKTIVNGATHWMVTEDGRIQGQMDSIYNLQRPYDLMALLKQEQRSLMLENLKQELLARKNDIDRNEDKDNGLEQKFYRSDQNCIAAGQPLIEFDLYMSTALPFDNKGIRTEESFDFTVIPSSALLPPDCTQYIPLDFSIHAFEHLEGMKDRKNLTMSPEVGLKNAITNVDKIDEYGHLINVALHKNHTSWVLYNMAVFYWRVKGSPYQAMECLRRALHYSPRHHKDVALISLGNILHHTHYSNEAAIVLHAALDVARDLSVSHFTLGNIYAVLADYNKSIICFENTLKIQPDFEAAIKRRNAVLCHSKLEAMLESKHRSLQKTLTELREYQQKHDVWHQHQQKLISEQSHLEEKIKQRLFYDAHQMNLADKEVGELCSMEEEDGRSILQCAWTKVQHIFSDYDFNPWGASYSVVMASEKKDSPNVDYDRPVRPPIYKKKDVDGDSTLEDQQNKPYLADNWPIKDECDVHVQKYPTWNEFPTTYLSPENKGFDVKMLLGKAQGLQPGEQHPFPWYPPVCSSLSDIPETVRSYDHLSSIKERAKLNARLADPSMKIALLGSIEGTNGNDFHDVEKLQLLVSTEKVVTDNPVRNGQITQDEIGQRILTALKQKIGPSWILYNLAGLYWRVVGNNLHGLDCVRRALYFVPDQYRDVPLLSLANILYRLGRVDDAVTIMKDALSINSVEPESQFFMGNLQAAVGNLSGAVHHYQMALAQDHLHSAAYSSLRLILCYQKFHRKTQSSVPKDIPSVPCPNGKRSFSSNDLEEHVVCSQERLIDAHYQERHHERCTVDGRGQSDLSFDINKMKALTSEHCNGQLFVEPLSDTVGGPSQFTDFSSQLEDITEYYREKGVCFGPECGRFLFQMYNIAHCEKLQLQDRNTNFNQQSYISGSSENKGIASANDRTKFSQAKPDVDSPAAAFNLHASHSDLVNSDVNDDIDDVRFAELLDPVHHITKVFQLPAPSLDECQKEPLPVNFSQFYSTWVSVTTRLKDFSNHIDFNIKLKPIKESKPLCNTSLIEGSNVLGKIRSLQSLKTLIDRYEPESLLLEALQTMGGLSPTSQPIPVISAQLSSALKLNATSWVVANLAALYWRVVGRADKAIECIMVAYHFSADEDKVIALLSLTNILQKCNEFDDALLVAQMALQKSSNLTATHFMMANLYAAKEDFERAKLFLESTLGLQQSFSPARERLRAILCLQLINENLPNMSN